MKRFNLKHMLIVALVMIMVLSAVPIIMAATDDATEKISNKEVPVTWSRSLNAADAISVNELGNFDLAGIYRTSKVDMLTTWSLLSSIDPNIKGTDENGNDLVWDGGNPDPSAHYTNIHLGGTYTSYPAATISGEGTTRFHGTFDLDDILDGASAGDTIFNMKIGIDPSATSAGQVALNDQMFIFLYPEDAELTDNNFMNYYVCGAGFEWLGPWYGDSDSYLSFNGVPMIHSFRDFAYYGGNFSEEAAAYAQYGPLLAGLGWEGSDLGWFGHGVDYLLYQDLANDRKTGIDQLYISDGLFYDSLNNELVVDMSGYGSDLPTKWVLDIFAVNTDAVGGLSKLNVYANYDSNTFRDKGSLEIGKTFGDKCSVSGSITGGYPEEAKPTIGKNGKETWDHTKYEHNLATALKANANNWFQFNEFTGSGGSFRLVQGDKLSDVGGYSITANGDGSFTITMSDSLNAVGAKVSISNTLLFAKNKNDKNFNENNIWTTSPGQLQFSGSGHSFTINAPWVDTSKTVYVFIHLDGLTGYCNTGGMGPGDTFTVNVQGPSYPDGLDVDVPINGTALLDDLTPGTYIIKEITPGYIPTFTVNGIEIKTGGTIEVEVLADQTTKVVLKNKQGDNPVSSEIVIKKVVQTACGFDVGAGFRFDIYADAAKTEYVGFLVTGNNGVGTFIADGYEVGTTFYLCENMNAAQSAKYKPQTNCFEVRSKAVSNVPIFDPCNTVTNCLLSYGGFTIEKRAQQIDRETYLRAGEGFTFAAYAAINADGTPAGDPIQTITTGFDGLAVFGPDARYVPGKTYYVFETAAPAKYITVVGSIAVTATANGAATFVVRDDLALGSLTIEKAFECDEYKCESITVIGGDITCAEVVQCGCQRPIYICVDAILGGTPFTANLLTENSLTKVGTYTISATGDGGLFVELNYDDWVVADKETLIIFGNANACLTLSSVNDNSVNNGSGVYRGAVGGNVTIPADDVKRLAIGCLQYFYLQSGICIPSGTAACNGEYDDIGFDFTVTGPDGFTDSFTLKAGESYTIVDLFPGLYTVTENASGWTATYSVEGGMATVAAGENTHVKVTNVKDEGTFSVQKLVETEEGYVPAAEAFTFAAFAVDGNGDPVGEAIQTVTTNSDGIAVFGPSFAFEPGQFYYVEEVMTPDQENVYIAQDPILVQAVKAGSGSEPADFCNDLATGSLKVTAEFCEDYCVLFYKPVYKTASSGTLVSWVGYGANAAILPDGFTGYFLNNGMTFFEVDVASLAELENGADIGIATSNKSGGPTINDTWNTSIGHSYNVKIADGKLVVTCDSVSGQFGVLLSDAAWSGNNNPTSGVKHNSQTIYDLPSGDTFYLFFHMQNGIWNVLDENGEKQITGWVFDHSEGPFWRAYPAADTRMTVTNADGFFYEGPLCVLNGLVPGEYTVAIFHGGNQDAVQNAVVKAGAETDLDFGEVHFPGINERVDM